MTGLSKTSITEDILNRFLDEVFSLYGYNLRGYSMSSLTRRIDRFMMMHHIAGIEELITAIQKRDFFQKFHDEIMVTVTEMFRDPGFFLELRKKIFPMLSTYSFIKIWDAGCSSGEEMVSLAILLKEEGLLYKTRIYATDICQKSLIRAKDGRIHATQIKKYTDNYYAAGGTESFDKYYIKTGNETLFDKSLLENVVFYPHNLITDGTFNEFNLILCRNVLIYFTHSQQEKIIKLLLDSLIPLGFLGIGKKESIPESHKDSFDVINRNERIYRKNCLI